MEALTEVFGGAVKLMTTPCIQSELQAYDRENEVSAAFVARRFEVRRCQHEKGKMTGSECIRDLISSKNPHHYCVAGQDLELRKELRKVAGVPLIFILRDTVVMEAPTDKTVAMTKGIEQKKLKKVDLKIIKKVTDQIVSSVKTNEDADDSAKPSKPKNKKKKKIKQKNPNPLSCKKAKKANESDTKTSTTKSNDENQQIQIKSKKPRKRRPKKKKSESKKD